MATLIPSSTAGREMSPAEQRLLERMGELDDAWRTYHGLRYVTPPGGGKPAVEGEIDVLVLHPDHGMLVLEVKGGGIQYDGRTRQFTSEDRTGRPNVIRNPFEQASRNVHELNKLMTSRPGWSETGEFWREEAALRLLEAVTELPGRFDVLVVDEAQDFETGWWTPLFGLLASREAPVSLFLDPDQDLWDRKTSVGEKLPVFPIRSNRR